MGEFYETLVILLRKLDKVEFAILGSYNLYLQGINIIPNDLDLITDDRGMSKIGKIFKSKIVLNESGYKETEFNINNVEVHVVSNINNKFRPPFRNDIVWLEKDDLKVPSMSLVSELSFYEKINRGKDKGKIELIQEKISKK
ncbi:MAG: hypothetical protein UU51_C0016G0008 [Microgenomates group bacterium GW2011_GWC1_41_20]|uniref:Uncharacterized protein n=7 Tax=Candidatus Woeseibacteriota TaxID=1752722 RepID=A0A0G0RTE1_9BACT|nr:MAG: hypothetical protein UT76_C0009G0007 [Candidatus Woesebacteria bacterium GW2011_GWB1_40_12]KKR55964.1 MAG: hypothetical protein UT93_C0009G0007 [Candidatus Woesebacteria bacterium GW2011_GWF1_40_24]KKR90920.1 MAG: hypothetical protein UU39_C0004G0005 [Candidatus Woesebacteria bacterium GW2011_GWD1_41_12]KKS00174.1 MAG: hypothetical protein UU51_C0016G0008 [Microgenomates group bacterium GW2011_GWC1_41_20]KKS05476.1 MAG: hypothetical protein UU57_C0005G0005 [Candidatus Woesebacteria bact